MQAKLYGQNQGGGLKLNGTTKEVYAEENVAKGDLLEYIGDKVRKTRTNQFVGVAKSGGIAGALVNMWTLGVQEGYITNGLVAHFSGEDNYKDGAWVDRVSGYKFTPLSTSAAPVYDAEYKLYDQNTFGGMVSDFTIPAGADFSFEVVARDIYDATSSNLSSYYGTIVGCAMDGYGIAGGGIVFIRRKQSDNGYAFGSQGSSVDTYKLPRSEVVDDALDTFTYVPNVGMFRNGVKLSDAGESVAERKIGLFTHYSGSYTSYYRGKAKIHCVRVYDRQLTAEEVAQNRAEDIKIYGE